MVLFVLILYSRQMTEDSFTWCNFNDLEIPTWFLVCSLYLFLNGYMVEMGWMGCSDYFDIRYNLFYSCSSDIDECAWMGSRWPWTNRTVLRQTKFSQSIFNELISESYYSHKAHFLVYSSIQTFPTGPNPKQLFSSSINGNNFQSYSNYSIIRNLFWITFTTSMESEAVPVCVYSLDMNETRLANE